MDLVVVYKRTTKAKSIFFAYALALGCFCVKILVETFLVAESAVEPLPAGIIGIPAELYAVYPHQRRDRFR